MHDNGDESKLWDVMAEFGGCYIWNDGGTTLDVDTLPNVTEDLIKRFEAWQLTFERSFEAKVDWELFHKEGRALALELQQVVGPDIEITYEGESLKAED